MKILFVGDVVGKVGRLALSEVLPSLKESENIDFVIVNGENVTHGKGLIEKHYTFLCDLGIDAITLGNHYNSKRQITDYIEKADRLIRPLNILQDDFGGEGSRLFSCKNKTIRVTNLLLSAFMNEEVKNPFMTLNELIENDNSDIHILDLHGEATGEKQAISYSFDGKITAILGTHTHVQTNDERILPKGTAYITDAGFCGSSVSVLGFDKESVINKTLFGSNDRFKLEENGDYIFNAVILEISDEDNKATNIKKIRIDTYGKN